MQDDYCEKLRFVGRLAKLEWVHFAIQEAQNGNLDGLEEALDIVEELREPYLNLEV